MMLIRANQGRDQQGCKWYRLLTALDKRNGEGKLKNIVKSAVFWQYFSEMGTLKTKIGINGDQMGIFYHQKGLRLLWAWC